MFRLEIQKRSTLAASDGLLGQKVSFILGVIVGMIFILLFSVLFSVFTMKQRKHKTERKQESPDLDFMLDTDQSTPLVIKRETLSRDCENGETPRWASQKYNESSFSSPTNIETR